MGNKGAVVIHGSQLIRAGLIRFLQESEIKVIDFFITLPGQYVFKEINDSLIFADCSLVGELRHFLHVIKLNNNVLVGIDSSQLGVVDGLIFDQIISVSDSFEVISDKIGKHLKSSRYRQNNPTLSPREIDVLRLISRGCSSKEIADKLFISLHTVNTHRKNISSKLGIRTLSGLTLYAVLNGIID